MFPSNFFRSFFGPQSDFIDPFFMFMDNNNPFPQGQRVPRPPYTNRQYQQSANNQTFTDLKRQKSVTMDKSHYSPMQGQYWCIEADEAYERKDYKKSIEYYSKAIELSEGTESAFFRCRGVAFKQMNLLDEALKDAIQAIELDDKNIKAHLLCGQVLAEMGKSNQDTQRIQTSITRLTKAMTLCAGQKKEYYEKMLSTYIYRAKKLLFYRQEEIKNLRKKQAIQNYRVYLDQEPNGGNHISLQAFIDSIGDPDRPVQREIPEFLICRITMEIMENPVVSESGQSYELDVLVEHLKKNGAIDPITRQPISGKYYPNINIKKAIEDFLLKNPWAFEYTIGEDYRDIQF